MSRIRSVHPGFFKDERLVPCSAFARLLFIGLGVEADDKGIFEWKPVTLKMNIFPADNVDVAALLAELVEAASVQQYEIAGRKFGAIRNFRKFQKPKTPNSIHPITPEIAEYVALPASNSETDGVEPEVFPLIGGKSPQMEDGGGREEGKKTPPPVLDAEGARDFDEVWEAFPRNPTSNRAKAEAAFSATKASDRPAILAAALQFARWFAEDCVARKRTEAAGLKFAPHLSTWIETEGWRTSTATAPSKPVLPMVRLNRMNEPAVWEACERLQGKPAATSDATWSFPLDIVVRARAELAQPASDEVH